MNKITYFFLYFSGVQEVDLQQPQQSLSSMNTTHQRCPKVTKNW